MIDRLNTALEGRYSIERELGEGGMATVFLAGDRKHDRQVALKVLRPELAAVVGAERFLAEIKTTAQLQHPHVLPLHDSGEADGFLFYVMPYVEGESLRERLEREQQLPVDEAVAIARKVASALQYAHEQGVVHRDIKPANILLSRGEPVVADFGIALAVSHAGRGRITETGLSLGTPHYMSPEQASGERTLDKRSDVYALGAVLYEMLTGEPPYGGPTAQAVLARILTETPRRVTAIRRTVPPHVEAVVAKSLEKLPADRFASADEFKGALTDEGFRYRSELQARASAARTGEARTRVTKRTAALAGVIGVLVIALGWMALRPEDAGTRAVPVYRYVVTDPLRHSASPVTDISRNGDVVYTGAEGSRVHLRLRRAGDPRPTGIPNTDNGTWPSFSPDGEWVAFLVGGRELKKVHLTTGTVVTLVAEGELERLRYTDWPDDGTVLFVGPEGIYRVDANGGVPEVLVESRDPAEIVHPRLLPDGMILLTETPGDDPGRARVVALDPETGDTTTVADPGGNAFWSPTGHVIHGHSSGTIFAVPFDLERREVTGPPTPVHENVLGVGEASFFSLSETGSLAYVVRPVADDPSFELAWLAPDGSVTGIPLEPTDHGDARLSPDGRYIAYTRNGHIDVYDTDRRTNRRLTFEGDDHHDPVWSPDGRRIAFTSDREGGDDADIYAKAVDGRSPAEPVVRLEGDQFPQQWLDGGRLIASSRRRPARPPDVVLAHIDGEAEPVSLLPTVGARDPRVSPDGRLLAYLSSEAGQHHVIIRELPDLRAQWQVSVALARGPLVWAPEGDALFYHDDATGVIVRTALDLEGAVEVRSRSEITTAEVGSIRDIHPDGRILIVRNAAAGDADGLGRKLVVAGNWFTELRRRLGEEDG